MAKPPGAPALPFANDGSFMEQFMKVRARLYLRDYGVQSFRCLSGFAARCRV